MISPKLQHHLLHDVFDFTGGAAPAPTGYLYALIEMGAQSQEKRVHLREALQGWLYPLLTEPDFEPLTWLGAMLVAAPDAGFESQRQLLERLEAENSDVVGVWITSVLPPEQMAQHLRQATFAYGAQSDTQNGAQNGTQNGAQYGAQYGAQNSTPEQRYLLRYYDPLITPVLYGRAPEDWQRWFFGPVISWWLAQPTAHDVNWLQLAGYRTAEKAAAPRLVLTPALLEALASDPLPYRLLPLLEALDPPVFTQPCRGMRLAQVQALFDEARALGLTDSDSQCDYVRLRLQYPALAQPGNAQWQRAIAQARSGPVPLARLLGL